ncbi:hypothetical protein SSPO_006940 [Streptomyces antimycoticus]|uniref:Uncharacterized protein n=1 Tax=Streptomyces antimycoticus TaxID=68175 RepID=A0A499UMQ6_9ACTN|nr:hypothetical protein SSPO_006940 [Streptomyces antimycoticus]
MPGFSSAWTKHIAGEAWIPGGEGRPVAVAVVEVHEYRPQVHIRRGQLSSRDEGPRGQPGIEGRRRGGEVRHESVDGVDAGGEHRRTQTGPTRFAGVTEAHGEIAEDVGRVVADHTPVPPVAQRGHGQRSVVAVPGGLVGPAQGRCRRVSPPRKRRVGWRWNR